MNRDSNEMDEELAELIDGLTVTQIELMASIYAGLAERLEEKKVKHSLTNWKSRNDYSRN